MYTGLVDEKLVEMRERLVAMDQALRALALLRLELSEAVKALDRARREADTHACY